MPTYKQFRLENVAPAQAGFGLIGPDCRSFNLLGGQQRVPLLSIKPRPRTTRFQQLWPLPSQWSRPQIDLD